MLVLYLLPQNWNFRATMRVFGWCFERSQRRAVLDNRRQEARQAKTNLAESTSSTKIFLRLSHHNFLETFRTSFDRTISKFEFSIHLEAQKARQQSSVDFCIIEVKKLCTLIQNTFQHPIVQNLVQRLSLILRNQRTLETIFQKFTEIWKSMKSQ